MSFLLPPLPYDRTALEPHMSEKTFSFHYDKHHKAYVDKLNSLLEGKPLADADLETVIRESAGKDALKPVFNNAAQVWNHTFFWHSMTPQGGGKPSGAIAALIERDFGSYEKFAEQFKEKGIGQFGSGWVWLVLDQGVLKVINTPNADLPMVHGLTALLTADVWEHAYYIDYQNKRPDYLGVFLNNLVNWDFANENLAKAV